MSHKPECIITDLPDLPDSDCMCARIAKVEQREYQRGRTDAAKDAAPIAELAYRDGYADGREDAAKAVESAIPYLNSLNMPTSPAWTFWESQIISGCIAAARGESDAEDRRDCWDCAACTDPECGCIGCGSIRREGK